MKEVKFYAECDCGKTELTEEELQEGKENGCVMCNKCFMPKLVIMVEGKEDK